MATLKRISIILTVVFLLGFPARALADIPASNSNELAGTIVSTQGSSVFEQLNGVDPQTTDAEAVHAVLNASQNADSPALGAYLALNDPDVIAAADQVICSRLNWNIDFVDDQDVAGFIDEFLAAKTAATRYYALPAAWGGLHYIVDNDVTKVLQSWAYNHAVGGDYLEMWVNSSAQVGHFATETEARMNGWVFAKHGDSGSETWTAFQVMAGKEAVYRAYWDDTRPITIYFTDATADTRAYAQFQVVDTLPTTTLEMAWDNAYTDKDSRSVSAFRPATINWDVYARGVYQNVCNDVQWVVVVTDAATNRTVTEDITVSWGGYDMNAVSSGTDKYFISSMYWNISSRYVWAQGQQCNLTITINRLGTYRVRCFAIQSNSVPGYQ